MLKIMHSICPQKHEWRLNKLANVLFLLKLVIAQLWYGMDLWYDDEQNQHHPENTAYQTSFDDVTYGDLRPDDFDNNHPDTIHFR